MCPKPIHKTILECIESRFIERNLFKRGEGLLVAVSGGVDSMVLLDLLTRLRSRFDWRLEVVHVNHYLRGEESLRDQAFVEDACAKQGIPCHLLSCPVKSSSNLEDEARRLRYEALDELRQSRSLDRVVLGHQADDQVELFFMRVASGSGLTGAGGMSEAAHPFRVRPLLWTSRREIMEYAKKNQVAYVDDSSNLKLAFRRNQYRHRLLPVLAEIQPEAFQNVLEFMEILREEEGFLDRLAEQGLEEVLLSQDQGEGWLRMDLERLASLDKVLQSRILLAACDRVRGSRKPLGRRVRRHLENLARQSAGCEECHLAGGLSVYREYQRLEIYRGKRLQPAPFCFEVPWTCLPGTLFLEGLARGIVIYEGTCLNHGLHGVSLDRKRFVGALQLRSWQPGDWIRLPWSGHARKLKRYFHDKKIARLQREKTVVVVDEGWDEGIVALLNEPEVLGGTVVNAHYAAHERSDETLNIALEGNIR